MAFAVSHVDVLGTGVFLRANQLIIGKILKRCHVHVVELMAAFASHASVPSRVLIVFPTVGNVRKIILELQQKTSEIFGTSNVIFDVAQDGYEGLQLFERGAYDALFVASEIGKKSRMKGIEFIKIASLMNNGAPLCPSVIVINQTNAIKRPHHLCFFFFVIQPLIPLILSHHLSSFLFFFVIQPLTPIYNSFRT